MSVTAQRPAPKKERKKGLLGLFCEPPRLLENIGNRAFCLKNCPLWPHSSHNARPLEGGPAGRDPRTELMLHGCEGPARPSLIQTRTLSHTYIQLQGPMGYYKGLMGIETFEASRRL